MHWKGIGKVIFIHIYKTLMAVFKKIRVIKGLSLHSVGPLEYVSMVSIVVTPKLLYCQNLHLPSAKL